MSDQVAVFEKSELTIQNGTISDSEITSADELEIDINETSVTETSVSKISTTINEDTILKNLEQEIERQLNEKASKSNLTVTNVKNILKHVITNEHVLEMVRIVTDENYEPSDGFLFEPKLTRAKTKELLKVQNAVAIPWATPKKSKTKSAVHILINEELPEDSDDDEYVPSEDDKESCHPSDLDSQPRTPATPVQVHDSATQTNWTNDGVFKIPQTKSQSTSTVPVTAETKENIALRTRSKLSLSDTPLEVIEEAFVPPDITTDMYDLECDDEDWREFLTTFTRPLNEAVPPTQEDDDETDPEYNILAEGDIEKVDKEELRQDRGVKVTKRELNTLVAELFEFSEMFDDAKELEKSLQEEEELQQQQQQLNEQQIAENYNETDTLQIAINNAGITDYDKPTQEFIVSPAGDSVVSSEQLLLLAQQMRQHVQLATQHFLLTFQNPVFEKMANTYKNMLLSLKSRVNNNANSVCNSCNLQPSLTFITDWENLMEVDSKEVREYKQHVENSVKNKGRDTRISTFSPLLLQKVCESEAFIYPSLLPTIMFRNIVTVRSCFTQSEDELIALGLDQFIPYMENDSHYKTKFGRVRLGDVAYFIYRYMMPHLGSKKIYNHILALNELKSLPNPIKYYFTNKKAPLTLHYVAPLDEFGVMAPCKRPANSLPFLWRMFIYPPPKAAVTSEKQPSKKVQKPPPYNAKLSRKKKTLMSPTKSPLSNGPQLLILNDSHHYLLPNNFEVTSPSILLVAQPKSFEKPTRNIEKLVPEDNHSVQKSIVIGNEEEVQKKQFDDPVDLNKSCSNLKNISGSLLKFKFNSTIFRKKSTNEVKMLPSMPFLATPAKDSLVLDSNLEEVSSTSEPPLLSSPEPKSVFGEALQNNRNEITNENKAVEQKKDNEDELNALMIASSTIQQKNRRLPNCSTKKAKQIREHNAILSMLCPEDKSIEEGKAKKYAQAFYDKVQERLANESPLEYQKFMEALSEHDETTSTVSELYEKVESVLSPNHPDLCDEFLTFLTPEQAKQIGKLVPHFMLSNMSLFLRKLEIYYNKQPAQLRRIYNGLTELATVPDVTMDKVRSTILPLLKGNSLLTDWFLQMFPTEQPPESLMNDWEEVSYDDGDNVSENEKQFETMTLPEVEDPYGGPNCICKCHEYDNEMYRSRARHCIPCGTKFLQGRIYVQTGKGLRLANVTFNTETNVDHNKRLGVKSTDRQKRKCDSSPSKLLMSPTKQDDEPRHSNESEDDVNTETTNASNKNKRMKTLKSFHTSSPAKKRTRRKRTNKSTPKCLLKKKTVGKSKQKSNTNVNKKQNIVKQQEKELEKEPELEQPQRPIVNKIVKQTDDSNSSELPIPETKPDQKPKPEATESESEICIESTEDSSQDTLVSDDSVNEDLESIGSVNSEDESCDKLDDVTLVETETAAYSWTWTRDEDKIILQTFQERGDSQNVFKDIQMLLPNRTVVEIQQRFQTLMSLLQEMASNTATTH